MSETELQFNYEGLDSFPDRLELSIIGGNEVSTVKLPKLESTDPDVWETCLFREDGSSDVICQYSSEQEARVGHRKFADTLYNYDAKISQE